MYYMIMLIISNLESSFTVLDTWEENGVPGVTILETSAKKGQGMAEWLAYLQKERGVVNKKPNKRQHKQQ